MGHWFSIYQSLNALAHLDLPFAQTQLEKAFKRLWENQNRDGTWSRSEPEWNTFLAISCIEKQRASVIRIRKGYKVGGVSPILFCSNTNLPLATL